MVGRPPELSLRNEQKSDLGGYDLVTFTQKGERKEGEADPIKLTQKGELTLTLTMTNRLSVQQTEALKAEVSGGKGVPVEMHHSCRDL